MLPAKKLASLSSAIVNMCVWASSMEILHPCIALDPTFTKEFCKDALSFAVFGSLNVWPIIPKMTNVPAMRQGDTFPKQLFSYLIIYNGL